MINNVLRSLIRIVFPPWPIMKGSVGAALGRLLMHKSQTPVSPAPISLPEALPHLKIGAKLGKTFELTKFFQLTFLKGSKVHASFAPASPTAKDLFAMPAGIAALLSDFPCTSAPASPTADESLRDS